MATFRVNKTKDYTTMSNFHLKDIRLSLKAKGLLSEMLSLPDNWDYSIQGLVAINKENEVAIKGALDELKNCNYLIVKKIRNEKGLFEYIYDIYEQPNRPGVCFPGVDIPGMENQVQINTNNKILKETNNINIISKEKFKKPTLEEVQEYCIERNNNVNPKQFFDYYEVNNWVDNKGNKVRNWKQKLITWEKHSYTKKEVEVPSWFDKDLDVETPDQEMEEALKELII